jgi:hypothetical protein
MSKVKIDNYSFDKTTKKITFTDYTTIRLDAMLLITDVTHNLIIYNFADPLKGGTVATNVLTLTYDTSALANTDKLLIYYDDANGMDRVTVTGRNLGKTAQISPMRALSTFDQIRLCGTPFHGATKDPNFWSETGTGANGSITQGGGQAVLTTTTDSGSAAVYTSIRTGRYISGSSNKFRAVVRLPDLGTPANNNVREFGAFTATDGFLFQLAANVFNIVVRKASTADNVIPKASWTGTYAAAFTLDTNVHTYEIQWTNSSAWFFIDDNIVHTVKGETAPSTATLTFPVCAKNINTGVGPAVSLNVRTMAILRMGKELSIPQYKNISGNAATYILKYGPGTLRKIVFNNTTGTSLAVWDGLTGAAPSIAIGKITTAAAALGHWDFDCPFFSGLTIITLGNDLDATVIYE